MMNTALRLMSGVVTGYLTPIVPAPKPLTITVGVEIEPGLGISLDGHALLVGPKEAQESFEIHGHPEFGVPVRDFQIHRHGNLTEVDGCHAHQDYRLEMQARQLRVVGETALESFRTSYRCDGFDVGSPYSNRSYKVDIRGSRATVKPGSGDGMRYQVAQDGNRTRVRAGYGGGELVFERQADGSILVDGPLNTQDFRLSPSASGQGWELSGFYPHQGYQIG